MNVTREQLLSRPVFAQFVPLTDELKQLSADVQRINSTLKTRSASNGMSLDALRREILKTATSIQEMKQEADSRMGLHFVGPEDAADIQEVAEARNMVAAHYLDAYNLEVVARRISRAMRDNKDVGAIALDLHKSVTENRRNIHGIFWALPDLGMTFHDWNEMTEQMRKKLRPNGRPVMPLECRILQAQDELEDMLTQVNKLSGGAIKTLEQAIDGATLSNRGRPMVSPLVKLDRKVAALRRDLEELNKLPKDEPKEREKGTSGRAPATRDQRIAKVVDKIKEMEAQILDAESQLTGAEVPRRKLEKLRFAHRDLVAAESSSTGRELMLTLLEILKNEHDQVEVINRIYELDANAKETLTHQVNPKGTRDRIERMRMSNYLDEAELRQLETIEESMRNTKVIRSRSA